MTDIRQMDINFGLLPIELQHKIYKQFTLEELFALNRHQLPLFASVDSFIDNYLEKQKYKEQTNLKDCIFLMNFEEYRTHIYHYFYELVATIGINFVDDVNKAGGPIGYMQLDAEEHPRDIYTIKIVMVKDSDEFEYIITSVGGINNTSKVYHHFGFSNRPKNTKFVDLDVNDIVDTLTNIVDLMTLDGRRIKSIRYYREKYHHDFLIRKAPILYFDNGFNLFY